MIIIEKYHICNNVESKYNQTSDLLNDYNISKANKFYLHPSTSTVIGPFAVPVINVPRTI